MLPVNLGLVLNNINDYILESIIWHCLSNTLYDLSTFSSMNKWIFVEQFILRIYPDGSIILFSILKLSLISLIYIFDNFYFSNEYILPSLALISANLSFFTKLFNIHFVFF